jgi:hypothetical protein
MEAETMTRQVVLFACTALVAASIGTFFLAAADPPANTIAETKVLMRAKLSSSQKVLEGLLAEDFTLIAHGAREMLRISEAAEWPRARDAVYDHYATEFRRQCIKLESLANSTNHQGASFTYLHMTTTCINCHDYVRDSLRIAREPNGGVQLIPAQMPER